MIKGIGKNKKDDLQDESLRRNSMDFLWKEAGNAAKGCFNTFSVIGFQKSQMGFIFSFSPGISADA